MKDPIIAYLNHYKLVCPDISFDELKYIEKALTITTYKAKQDYLDKDKIQKSIGFVFKGLLKLYYVDDDGNEITVWFSKENEYVTEYTSFIKQQPSNYYIKCLEPCIIVNLSFEHIQEGYNLYKNIVRYGRLITEEVFVLQQYRLQSFLFQNAQQRYLDFITKNPGLFNRVSLTDLASFLGIERQSLSRIRKTLSLK